MAKDAAVFDISVVIPLYNALGYLPALLTHLEQQTFDLARFEVILVDDCSTDLTKEHLTELQKTSPLNLQLVWRKRNGGVSAARNSGWQTAQAPVVLFIDQDCLATPELLASHYAAHMSAHGSPVAWVGRIVWSENYQENPASEYFKATYFPGWETYQPDGSNFQLFITSNASVARAGLVEAGGFDEAFRHNYDDVSCGYRLEQVGYRIALCPDALVYHHRPLPIAEMFRRTNLAGHETARFYQHYPALIGHNWLLNPAQALDWAYRLGNLSGLFDYTIDRLSATALQPYESFLAVTGQYLLNQPFLHHIDKAYLQTWWASRSYQQQLTEVRWLEAALELRLGPDYVTPPSRVNRLKKGLQKFLPRNQPASVPAEPVSISVIGFAPDPTAFDYVTRFLQALSRQNLAHASFEVILVLPSEQFTHAQAVEAPFELKLVAEDAAQNPIVKGVAQAAHPLLVCLPLDSVPVPGLLETYQQHYRPDIVQLGLELPLQKDSLAGEESLPDLTDLADLAATEVSASHFSVYTFLNSAISTALFRTIAKLTDNLHELAIGWQLATQGIRFQNNPTAVSYAFQTRRVAQRLLGANQQAKTLEAASPDLVLLHTATLAKLSAPTENELHLLFNTFKEYPFSLGLAQGLQNLFGIPDREVLAQQPFFKELVVYWEQKRLAVLQTQRAELLNGQQELTSYLAKLRQTLAKLA